MLRAVLEENIEEYFRLQIIKAGGRAEKTVDLTRVGAPDREVQWPLSLACAGIDKVELKKEGATPEPHQTRYHEYLASCGIPVYLIDCKQKVDEYIRIRLTGKHNRTLFSVPLIEFA